MISLLALCLVAAAFLVPLPYYVNGPGSVSPTEPLVSISGHKSYVSKGTVMFTTVSESRATAMLLLRAWLDDSIDSIPAEEAFPKGNRTAVRRVEQAQMDRSKLAALMVAFDKLGLPLTVTGEGALIQQINDGFPADGVLEPGDVIVGLDGTKISTLDQVSKILKDKLPGTSVELKVLRQGRGEPVRVDLTLAKNDEDLSHGYLGVMLMTFNEDVRTPFKIDLDSGKVVGPSAGLAWTLAVIDRLSPGDLTHGQKVAVTGTMSPDGTVGPIGGIGYKIVGAKEAGATLFLYPADTPKEDLKRVKEVAGDEIEIRPVATIDDALKVLDPSGLGAGKTSSPR